MQCKFAKPHGKCQFITDRTACSIKMVVGKLISGSQGIGDQLTNHVNMKNQTLKILSITVFVSFFLTSCDVLIEIQKFQLKLLIVIFFVTLIIGAIGLMMKGGKP